MEATRHWLHALLATARDFGPNAVNRSGFSVTKSPSPTGARVEREEASKRES